MNSSDSLLAITSQLYDAAINPNYWVEVLDSLALKVGAKGSALLVLETLSKYSYSINKTSSLFSDEIQQEYTDKYSEFEARHFEIVAESTPGKLVFDDDYLNNPLRFMKRPDVQYLQNRCGVYERFAVRLNHEKAWFDCITFQYDMNRGNITKGEQKKLQKYLPHIAKATELSRVYLELRARFGAVLCVLDRFQLGVCIALPSSEVILQNATAEKVLSRKNGLYLSTSKLLKTENEQISIKLKQAIRNVSQTANGLNSKAASHKILVPSNNSLESYIVDISPLKDTDSELDSGLTGAIITIVDTERDDLINLVGFDELYKLSVTEVLIAELLVQGYKYQEMAETRNVSLETIKTQVNSVFNKTGVRSRSELFALALKINIPIV